MIAASRRRRDALSKDSALRLHLRLARRAALDRRLANASYGALGGSLVGLVFAPNVAWHAALAVAGAVVGALLPTPDSLRRAFASIRRQAGLSYETALELRAAHTAAGQAEGPDPYGFAARVEERAHLSVRDVKPISPPAWWVPLLLVAFGLLLIPGLAPAGGDGPGAALGPAPQQQDGAAAGADLTDEDSEDAVADNQELGRVDEPDGVEDPDGLPDAGAQSPGSDAGQEAPLTRFLQNLRERPADVTGGGAQDGADDERTDQGESAGGNPLAEGEADPRPFEIGDGSEAGERGAVASSGERDPEGQAVPDPEAADEGEGQGDDEQGEGAGQQAGERNPFEQAGGPSEQDAAGQDLGGGEGPEGGDGLASAPDEGGDGGADGVAGEGAGALGQVVDQDAAAGGESDLLQGVLTDGPESSLGTVLLPGRDEVELPEGFAYAPYAAAAEDAMSEGDLPLEYQEIIRRYFQ